MAEYLDHILQDWEDIKVLAEDGSSSDLLSNALALVS
jgi:hypothetical protein